MQKIKKTNDDISEIFKDGHTHTHGQGLLLRTPSGKLGVQNVMPYEILLVLLKHLIVSLTFNVAVLIQFLLISINKSYQ